MPVTFDKLGNQLLDASHRHGNDPLLFSLLELYCLVERTLERQLEIRRNRRRFRFGALRIATLSRFEPIVPWRMAGADLVLRVRCSRLRSSGRIDASASACAVSQLVAVGPRERSFFGHEPLPPTEIHSVSMSFLLSPESPYGVVSRRYPS